MTDKDRSEWLKTAMDQYEGPLTRYAAAILSNADQARDAVQDTFMRLWQSEPAQIEARLAEWLFTVCRNRSLDIVRKEGRMNPLDEIELGRQASADQSPQEQTEMRDTYGLVMKLLARLPSNQQEVIRLKFQNGLSYEEISRVTNRTVSNVGVLIHMAMKTLRQQMETCENENFPR